MLFREKGCARCHQQGRGGAGPDLSREPLRKSISEICGTVWNHSLAMQAKMQERGVASARLDGTELADILGHIYFLHFSRDEGDAARGERVFRTKGCFACHSGGGAGKQGPNLASGGRRYDMLGLATSMWNHAPIMFETMESQIMKWIKLDPDDMQDLSRYLKSIRGEEESAIRESRR
jgi:mono/diheme cytochrome c family protein